MKKYLKLMRVHHYIKNFLIFAPLACSGQLFRIEKLLPGVTGFWAFCLISSAVYILNDLKDVEKDRKHPTKCKRPIASGAVSRHSAAVLAMVCILLGGVCVASSKSHGAFIWLAVYLGMNVAYSLGLKNVPLVDIAILAAGFLIRILYGACLTQIVISNWLYLTVMAMALYFALGKRRNELKRLGGETRAVLKAYPVSFLDKNMSMCLTLANVFYALWSMNANTQQAYHSDFVIFTVPIVLLITLRYSMNVEGDSDGDPVEVLLHDKTLLLLCLVYAAAMFIILYVF